MPALDLDPLVAFAEELADLSGPLIRGHFRTGVGVDHKSDDSPVTVADREAERLLRERIEQRYPEHGIEGEEHGLSRPEAGLRWVLDPIDGTRSFIAGRQTYGTLIALCVEGVPTIGVIDHPSLGDRWVGALGRPTLFRGEAVRVRACPELGRAHWATTSHESFEGDERTFLDALVEQTWGTLYGGDCQLYGLLASGHLDLVVEADLDSYDYCALAPVVLGAGGCFTDWSGEPVTLASDSRVIASGDERVAARVRELWCESDSSLRRA